MAAWETLIPLRQERFASAPPPLLGQHTAEILGELGYTAAQIAALRAAGTI